MKCLVCRHSVVSRCITCAHIGTYMAEKTFFQAATEEGVRMTPRGACSTKLDIGGSEWGYLLDISTVQCLG